MKLILEVLLSIFLHPIAMVLMVINVVGRGDLNGTQKLAWCLACLLWGLGPILYIVAGGGALW